jgi:hypothetical protein
MTKATLELLRSAGDLLRIPIFTFVTDDSLYSEMRTSFERAGFGDDRATFFHFRGFGRPCDPEPYSVLTRLISERQEPFFVLCHQDIRLDQGHGFDDLVGAIADLDVRDRAWAVAGNAGGNRVLRMTRRITDPHGASSYRSLPTLVHSLDENFLVVKTGTGICCSPTLTGFHIYGTDLCLNALRDGRTSYVIDFHVHHLSGGTRDAAYRESCTRFTDHWNATFLACYVRTPMEVLFIGRWSLLRYIFGNQKLRRILKNHASMGAPVGLLFTPRVQVTNQHPGEIKGVPRFVGSAYNFMSRIRRFLSTIGQ